MDVSELRDDPTDGPGRFAVGAYRPAAGLITGVVAALISMAVCAAAILAPAPIGAVPLVVPVCFGSALLSGREVPLAFASLRRAPRARALASLRASLAQLPETEHPLGL